MGQIPFSRFPEVDWSGQTVNVIAGGTSIAGFPFHLLDGVTIGPNKCAFAADTDILVSLDHNFYRNMNSEIAEYALRPGKITCIAFPKEESRYDPLPGVTFLHRVRTEGMSMSPDTVSGYHSGAMALNVAFFGRPKKIRILGMDMTHAGTSTHWHGGYEFAAARGGRFMGRWAHAMRQTARELEAAGIECVNYIGTPASMIEWFPRVPLADLLSELTSKTGDIHA